MNNRLDSIRVVVKNMPPANFNLQVKLGSITVFLPLVLELLP